MEKHLALIVDDEPHIRELLELTLLRMGIESKLAATLNEGEQLLKHHHYDLCLTDMRLPDGNGIELVRHIQQQYPELPVAIISAHGNMDTAIEGLKAGAFDFISKPVDLKNLRNIINSALKLSPKSSPIERRTRDLLLGDSKAMQKVRGTITKLARSQAPVYISGESGTGKEMAARLIHQTGPRASRPFVPVNCGAIPSELMESEFFGHKKGSFTGATQDKEGFFKAADGGTLFLDEVADLPLAMQVKLLRAIQEKAVRAVGSEKELPVDVRILSATHKKLAQRVEQGSFRQDLYYRINVIELPMPSLGERQGDIELLAKHILNKLAKQNGCPLPRLEEAAKQRLLDYSFPGNVRELENILERAMTLCEEGVISEEDLALPKNSTAMEKQPTQTETPLDNQLEETEKQAIIEALEKSRYNKTAAAKLLGISFRALRYRLEKLGIK